MSAPSTTMVLENIGQGTIYAGGVEIAPNATQTYTLNSPSSGAITAVCADVNFWAAFLSGVCTMTLNGQPIPNTSGPVVAFLIEIGLGNINPT
jgi:hypothetical protein